MSSIFPLANAKRPWLKIGLGLALLMAGCSRPIPEPAVSSIRIAAPRCEYLAAPECVETLAPRFSWRLESDRRGAAQTAWQIRVATSAAQLAPGKADLWDSGRISGVTGSNSNQIAYAGKALRSQLLCYWQVRIWDERGEVSGWSAPAHWSMGLLKAEDWQAQWISFPDRSPVPTNRSALHLEPARHYRKDFAVRKPVRRATVYASALGLYDLYCNGQRLGDAYFQPGWSDYLQRAYYRSHDVTEQVRIGTANVLGAVVADGWYAGYVGYGKLVGYGPNQLGRNFYGKTPALLAQLVIEYIDGSRDTVVTDESWSVTDQGPTREADILMGESYDARREIAGWAEPGRQSAAWKHAVRADDNPHLLTRYSDAAGEREVDLGFVRPAAMEGYPGPPVRITQEMPAKRLAEPKPGCYVFDLGQNFAGIVRLKVKGLAGVQVRLRYGEMLRPDGMIMTENLRQARATDFYTLKGDPAGETWSPRFTYHGFQYVELTGLADRPELDAITGLVLQSDTPPAGGFECSDPVLTQFARNAQWTQRANFVEIPTDCPQRDERLGWMGDAQAYIRTASFNADVAAFFTKWIEDLDEAQRSYGAYPDYAPYPMAHGGAGKSFGSGWMDAGIICPWTVWKAYGDVRLLERHWASMTRFMEWRYATTDPAGLGTSLGNPWGDWLSVGEATPITFIDTCYDAIDCTLMAEMADALGKPFEAATYRARLEKTRTAFENTYLDDDDGGTLLVDTQSAYVLALSANLIPADAVDVASATLAEKIAKNGYRMATGFLGTRALLPVLSSFGYHDLATRLFQSRKFPSWGYEVANGANTVWERWDSYTTDHGFNGANGHQNSAMNSFSHYAFGSAMEWGYRVLAGIDSGGAGYRRILIRPRVPTPGSNPDEEAIDWVKAHYDSINGRIASQWRRIGQALTLDVTIPPNTTASVLLPTAAPDTVTEGGVAIAQAAGVRSASRAEGGLAVEITSGTYHFEVSGAGLGPNSVAKP